MAFGQLSAEQKMIVESAGQIAESEFADDAFTWHGEIPWENMQVLAEEGFLGINFPEEYGGGGMTEFEAMLLVEAVGQVCPDTATAIMTTHFVAPRAIEMFGSEAAKEEYLPPIIRGEELMAIAISEPEAGSDVAAMNTMVEEDDGSLVLNGEKIWVTNVPHSAAAVTWVKFDEGLGTVIVDLDDPGVDVAQHFTNMAGHTQTQYYMEDVEIPEENVLVRGKSAFKEQLKALNWERVGGAALANATALCALERTLDYVETRSQFGQEIGDFQGIEWKLADMVKDLEASRALAHRAAQRAANNDRVLDRMDSSICKLFAAEMANDVVDEALQIHGATGYQQGHPIEYLYRKARGRLIAGGTAEIQRNNIARALKSDGLESV